jgi:hypothetical protein
VHCQKIARWPSNVHVRSFVKIVISKPTPKRRTLFIA